MDGEGRDLIIGACLLKVLKNHLEHTFEEAAIAGQQVGNKEVAIGRPGEEAA